MQIKWTHSTDNSARACERKAFYTARFANPRARDGSLRREAFLLKQAIDVSLWRGNLVHRTIEKCILPSITKAEEPDFVSARNYLLNLVDTNLDFSRQGKYRYLSKTAAGDAYCVLKADLNGTGVTESELDEVKHTSALALYHLENNFSDLLTRARFAKEVKSEKEIRFSLDERILVEAIPDLIIFEPPDKVVIVDWKAGFFTKVWSKIKLYWEQGPDSQLPGRDNPRLDKVEVTNDAGQTRATSFDYDNYNNQTVVREHDFAAEGTLGNELRRTETTYEIGSGWIDNRLLRLPKEIKTIVGTATVSKTVYEYDKNGEAAATALTPRNDISTSVHNMQYQPAAPPGEQCAPQCDPRHRCCWEVPVYQANTRFRGNVTKIIAFPDTSAPDNDPNNVVSTIKYDIAGSVTETSGSCCDLKTTQYTNANHYAYPMSETRSGQGLSLTTSVTYDQATGMVLTATDENGQPSSVTYNQSNLRVTRTDSPNGAWTTTEYNDSVFPYHVKSTASLDSTRSVSSWSFANGKGQQFRTRGQTADGYVSSDVEFDIMGRPVKSFNPYTVANLGDTRPANIKFSEIIQRDGLGRTLQTKLPDDTIVSATYNGLVATATDQALKSRRQVADTLGRTIRVDEPDANGNLDVNGQPAQPTYYEHDGNDNLTKVTQTGSGAMQERLFKYDALSRLTHERQVEATATLNDAGIKVTSGGLWTGVYKYTNDNLLLEGVDARGVKTTFNYDGLNRTQTVTFTGETGYQTPTVTYTYDEAESGFFNNGRLTKVRTAPDTTYGIPETVQNYDFDKIGQVVKHIQLLDNQSYTLEYGYNLAGQLISEKYPSGRIVTNTVDNFGRLSNVADASRSYLTGVVFNNQGLLSQMNLGNGTNQTFSYNDRFQMLNQSLQRGTEVLQKYDYSYGTVDLGTGSVDTSKNNGQLGKIEGWIGASKQWSQRFGYDELGRLKEAREYKQGDNSQLTYKQRFDFDRFGNMYRKAANNNPSGQQNPLPYTAIEETTTPETGDIDKSTNRFRTGTTYDEAGQVVNDSKFRNTSFVYDNNGRQVKAIRSGVPDASTVYDALGNRVATKINDIWTFVVYDTFGKLIAEYGGVSATDEGGVRYVMQDWQGSPRVVVSNTGYVQSRSDFTSFGEEIASGVGLRTSAQGYGVQSTSRQGYGLTEKDDSTGLNHTWFRKQENRAGRWTSPDPYKGSMSLGNPQSFNRYSYVENQPTNFIDPTGLVIGISFLSCSLYIVERWNGEEWVITDVGIYCYWSTVYFPSDGGGGGGGGGDPAQPQKPKKPKCKQSRTPEERRAVEEQLRKVAPVGSIGNVQPALDKNGRPTEGIIFDIFNRTALQNALVQAGFNTNTIFNTEHLDSNGGNIFNTSDNRSPTVGAGSLGPDSNSNGITRSLQVVLNQPLTPGPGVLAQGYADLDCDNPAQDVVGFIKHAAPIIGGKIKSFFGKIF